MKSKLKYGALILTALGLVWLVFNQFNANTQQTESEATQPVDTNQPNNDYQKQQVTDVETKQESQVEDESLKNELELGENWQDEWLEQLSDRRYSEDAAVELTSVAMEYESCGNADLSWKFENLELNQKQDKIKIAVENYCQQLLAKYPLLANTQIQGGVQLVFDVFPASSKLGQFFQQQANESTRLKPQAFIKALIPLSIQAKNSQTLLMAQWMGGFGNRNLTFEPALVNSQNNEYLSTLQSIALTAISCDFQAGITCAPNSKFMQDKCFDQNQFCGQSIQQWYEQAVTPGMAKDVEIIKQHYLNQASELKE